jgi:hypothetical protein
MSRATTTTFITKTDDYFTAHLDNGGVRIGFVGGTCFDVPAGHAYYDRIVESTGSMVEEYHDELMSSFA